MATHSSVLACRIPGTGEPGGLPFLGLHRDGHDCSDLAAAAAVSETQQMREQRGLKNFVYSLGLYSETVRVSMLAWPFISCVALRKTSQNWTSLSLSFLMFKIGTISIHTCDMQGSTEK